MEKPWTAEDEGTQWAIFGPDGELIAAVYKDIKDRDREVAGNAAAIALVPELLEFIEITLAYLPPLHLAVKRGKELLAKAKGGTGA